MAQAFSIDEADWQKQGAEVTVSQNSQTGHTDITIGSTTTPVASVDDVEFTPLEAHQGYISSSICYGCKR